MLEQLEHAPIHPVVPDPPENPLFTFFRAPITNTQPHSRASLRQIYNAIKGDYYKPQTEKLRELYHNGATPAQIRKYKSQNFDYCTFTGIFTTRNDKAQLSHSGLICFDFDNVPDLKKLRLELLTDQLLRTKLLFTSPSGNGLKWVIQRQPNPHTHAEDFNAVSDYLTKYYNITPDKSAKDLSRACFLPHDPNAYFCEEKPFILY